MYSEFRYFRVATSYQQPANPGGKLATDHWWLEVGFPIRISADQSSFAAPHGFSQRSTSFIACAYQGIHRTPFIHSITLITNARPKRNGTAIQPPKPSAELWEPARIPQTACRPSDPRQAPNGTRQRSGKNQCHTRIFRFPRLAPGDPNNSSLHDVSKPATARPKRPNRRKLFCLLDKFFFVGLRRRRGHPSP